MKIVGICGSPRKNSNSTRMVEEVLRGAKDTGAQIEIIKLGDLKIEFCDGCLSCDQTGKCHFNDGMNEICERMARADGFVFGSPTRFDNVSGMMKNFMDRTNPLCKDARLKGKTTGLVTVGYWEENVSRERAINCFKNFCEAHEMEVIGDLEAYEKSGRPGEIAKKKDVLEECYKLGQRLAGVV
ncbi:MAG: flavodoxin family protein [Patescibacteria group bacterium]